MTYIIGLNTYHGDASACVLKNGEIIAAAEEERFVRVKHWAGFPVSAIKFCLEKAGVDLSSIDVIAINSNPRANILRKIAHTIQVRPNWSLVLDRLRNRNARVSIQKSLELHFPNDRFTGDIRYVEHHMAHMSSAFHMSPYENATVVSVDGFGDFASGCWGKGIGSNIAVESRIHYPHSLGAFYQAITQFIGFPNYGDEYKVMGLAPYGEPIYLDKMRNIVSLQQDGSYALDLRYFKFHKQKISYEWVNGSPSVGKLYSENLIGLLGPARGSSDLLSKFHKDIAASAQAMFEEALFHLLNKIYERHGLENLCLAGGCANNSVANGKIRKNTNFKNVYVAASAGDAGGAIGAAYQVFFSKNQRDPLISHMNHAYLGPGFSNKKISSLLERKKADLDSESFELIEVQSVNELAKLTALEIAKGNIVGWFQGAMEWGPRALGNRSILGDPRRKNMKDILNKKIKRRESFRPFAPSILRDRVIDWFEEDDDVPFMMKVFQFKTEKMAEVPAVCHVDGSGRLHTVCEKTNERYHALIAVFESLTGIPILLNTSFNENEPVVCSPEEALDCFLRTKMDVLVLNDYFIRRR